MAVQEILPADKTGAVLAVASAAFNYRVDHHVPEGLSIEEMMQHAGLNRSESRRASCWVRHPATGQETLISREHWSRVRPHHGMEVIARIRPTGAPGGGKKSGIGIIATILVMVISSIVTFGVGALLSAALAGVAGAGLIAGAVGSLAGGLVGMPGKLLIAAKLERSI